MEKEFRIEVKVKNNKMLKKIEEAGYKTVGEFCRLNDRMNWASMLGDIINLKSSPLNAEGQFRPFLFEVCDILLCSPEDLFSDTLLNVELATNRRTVEVSEAEAEYMLSNSLEPLALEDELHQQRLPSEINKMLETLTPREKKVIERRFGLNGHREEFLHEIGTEFGVTATRIRDIEARAIRKLYHSARSKKIREAYLEEDK